MFGSNSTAAGKDLSSTAEEVYMINFGDPPGNMKESTNGDFFDKAFNFIDFGNQHSAVIETFTEMLRNRQFYTPDKNGNYPTNKNYFVLTDSNQTPLSYRKDNAIPMISLIPPGVDRVDGEIRVKVDYNRSMSKQKNIQYIRVKDDDKNSYLYGTNQSDEFYTNMWDKTNNYYMYGGDGDDIFWNKRKDRSGDYVEIKDFRQHGDGDKINLYSNDGKYVFRVVESKGYIKIETKKSRADQDKWQVTVKIPQGLTYYDQDAKEEVEIDVGLVEQWLEDAANPDDEINKKSAIKFR